MKSRLFAFPFALLLLYPCEETGLVEQETEDAGTLDDGAVIERDASMPELQSLSYTPDGCDYEVATPELLFAERGGDEAGSEPTPYQVHVGWSGPTQSTFNVNWRTDGEGTTFARILYGTSESAVAGADDDTAEGVSMQNGHTLVYETATTNLIELDGRVTLHEVHVCGLEPDTTYYYKVGGPGNWSEVYDVATGPELGSTAPWSFASTGDSRNNTENAWPLSQRRVRDRGVDLQIFSGDAVFLGTLQPDWDQFFSASDGDFEVTDLLARVPLMMSNGNHDNLAVNYVASFAMPQEVSEDERAQGEEWYSFDYANAHFIVLNDSVADESVLAGAQASWLRADLEAVDRDVTPWVFAVHHRPFYTCLSTHRPDVGLRQAWQPVFDEYEVDIVFTGHNHVYERSQPIRGLEGVEGVLASAGPNGVPAIGSEGSGSGRPSGTLYVVAAGVGAPLYAVSDECPTTNIAESVQNYVTVEIEDRSLTFTARNAMTDAVIDEFSYSK
ncbi:MAG TPA: fibronectin type III domain-containing protein [Polyangiaceae bacterium LLY-WYZ-15_(1-7)]|nr:hypothetical protein [Sandaracinus sp.]HJL06197.1 fibronectin type III domain-containing protein [Polyangiaceae bacterium LLY-WYZ-15_(1-7)]HJL10908.1 fibronectin type III domain-containing protein [Polyangiaceae bacterium LLY-WYZ-15_(1-7)]HJL26637.1 fibronectin type III domain-containing protein [Polyangiaceae bacterium LLY-WYZ-15_(1-7)]HJL34527.1 fibronectin type III domain-containing protein [Polyangiaceae bacterium LLY-WYZ-15_(1-7)]